MKASSILLLYVLAVLSLASCKTSKNTEQQVNRDYSSDFDRLSMQMDSLRAGFNLSTRQVTDKLSNLKLEHVTTYYTLPDSAGRQYPVYVSTTRADKDEQSTEVTNTDLMATVRRLEIVVDSLSETVNAALKEERKAAELSWWDLHKDRVFGVAFVLLLVIVGWLVYRIRKK